jgi:hypothetical protein
MPDPYSDADLHAIVESIHITAEEDTLSGLAIGAAKYRSLAEAYLHERELVRALLDALYRQDAIAVSSAVMDIAEAIGWRAPGEER